MQKSTKPVGRASSGFDLGADCRVAQQRDRDLVELHVAAADRAERGDFRAKRHREVGEECVDVLVCGRRGEIAATIKMHGRRRGQRDFPGRAHHLAQEAELIDGKRPRAPDRADRIRRGEHNLVPAIGANLNDAGRMAKPSMRSTKRPQ